MSIKQNQGFLLQSPVPTVLRDAVDTIVDLKNINDNYYPDNYIVLCNEDNTVYLYTKSNSIDAITGKCRKLVKPETPFVAFPIENNTSAVYSDGLYKWFKGYGDWDLGKTYTYKTPNGTRASLVKRYDHKNVTSPTQESLFVTYEATYTPYLSKTIHYDCTGTRDTEYYAVFCAPHSSAGAIKFDFTTKTLSGSSTDPDWSAGNSITCMFDTNHDRVSFASLPKGFDIIASSVVGNDYTIAMKIPASYVGHLYFRTTGYFNDTNSTNGLTFMGASVLNGSVTWSFTYYNSLVDNLTTYDIVTYEQLREVPGFGTGSSILNYSLISSEHINIIEENTGSNSKTFNWAMDKAIYCSLWDKFTYLDTSKQSTLIAGNNITITNGNVISAEGGGSVEMASSTADVLKEKTLYFIPNNNAYDGYVKHKSNITKKVIDGASLKNHIDNKGIHLNTITIPTGNNGTAKCFKIMSIDDCSNFSNFTLLSNHVRDDVKVSNMSIDMIGIYDDSYGHKVFEHHVLGTSQVYCNKRTHMEEEQEILDGVDVYLYTTFFQNSNIVVTLLQGQNLLTDDITFGNLGTEEWANLQNVVIKKMDILPIDSVKGLQDKLNTLKQRAYTLDFGTDSELAQDSNMLGSITINNILTQNVSALYLSYGSVVRQSVPTSGTVSLQIPDSTTLTWEIVRVTENEPACVGVRFEILI